MKFLAALCIIATISAQGAADDITTMVPITGQDITKSVFGFAHSKHSKCTFIQSSELGAEPNCAITIASSDDPMCSHEQLQQIAEEIHSLKITNSLTLHEFCKAKITNPAKEHHIDDNLTPITGQLSYNFIVLYAILGPEFIRDTGYNRAEKGMCSSRLELWEEMGNGDFPESAKTTCHMLIPSKEPVTDPQAKAELEQENNSESPFTLIVNLNAWRKIVEAHRSTRLDENSN